MAINNPYPMYNPQQMNYNYMQQPYNAYFPYQQMQQQQRFQQPVEQPQQQMLQGINGKVVQVMENITANDVPMDGSVAFFPKQDMSEIYAKSWNADGTIKTVIFRPINEKATQNVLQNTENLKLGLSDDVTAAFMQRFDELSERLEQLEVSMNKSIAKPNNSIGKRKVDTE